MQTTPTTKAGVLIFKPCPYCSSTDITVATDYPGFWSAYCLDCQDEDSFSSFGKTHREAVVEWNLWVESEDEDDGAE